MRRSAHPEVPARVGPAPLVHAAAAAVVAVVALLGGGAPDAGLAVVGLVAAVLAGPATPGAPAGRLLWALGAGSVAMPLALVAGPAAWVLAGLHLGRALMPEGEPAVALRAQGPGGVGRGADPAHHRA